MNYKITIKDKTYNVEIEDINARPIVAKVDGVRFEVMPESNAQTASPLETRPEIQPPAAKPLGILPQQAAGSGTLTSPLPGTVTEVFVKAGEQVEAGQVVLIVEAMKMKNSIRATRGGLVAEVLVSAGQSVAHKQALMKFAE